MINWLTKEEIVEAATEGLLSALQCAWQHWKQLCEATEDELEKAYCNEEVNLSVSFCSLCLHINHEVRSCKDCPLNTVGHKCSDPGSAFDKASDDFYAVVELGHLIKRSMPRQTNDWTCWQQSSTFLRDLLEELYFLELEKQNGEPEA